MAEKVIIDKGEFEAWAKDKLVEYKRAWADVPNRKGIKSAVVFSVCAGGGFVVSLGNSTIYDGGSFSEAQSHFHSAQNPTTADSV